MMMMARRPTCCVIFLALETMSIAVYVLTGMRRDQQQSTEAAFKYFLLGAFASSFFLYGIAFTLRRHRQHAPRARRRAIAAQSMSDNPMILLGIGLLLVGFAFKIAAVPFHMWSPDAYEGAPAVVTGFMSTGVKAAAFAAFARVFLSALEPIGRRLGAGAVGDRRRDDDRRHRGRRRADQPQAHARVFEHRARRLPARRPGRRPTRSARRDAVLPARRTRSPTSAPSA